MPDSFWWALCHPLASTKSTYVDRVSQSLLPWRMDISETRRVALVTLLKWSRICLEFTTNKVSFYVAFSTSHPSKVARHRHADDPCKAHSILVTFVLKNKNFYFLDIKTNSKFKIFIFHFLDNNWTKFEWALHLLND